MAMEISLIYRTFTVYEACFLLLLLLFFICLFFTEYLLNTLQ